jgi:3-hydroxyisobutyrate dehydrogenase
VSGFEKVAFIGIGNMGWPMAARLVAAAFNVAVCDAVPGRAEKFAAEIGGTATPDAACAAADADAVITILPTSKHFADVIEQIRPQLKRGGLVIEMSSGIPSITKRLAAELAGDGVAMIDAPVSGGVSRAKAGELAIMTGGEAAALQRAAPLLKAMGTTVTEVGSIGAGQAMKALNNLVSAGGFLIGVEALLIGQAFGLVPEKMVDVLNASTGMNNSTQKKIQAVCPVARVQQQFRPRPDGEGSGDRAGSRARRRCCDSLRGVVQGAVAGGVGEPWPRQRPYGNGALLRTTGRQNSGVRRRRLKAP